MVRTELEPDETDADTKLDFDDVGSVVALSKRHPEIKLKVQYRNMMQHWADCVADVTTFDLFPTNPHAMLERLKVDPGDFFCMHIITIAIQHLDTLLPDG